MNLTAIPQPRRSRFVSDNTHPIGEGKTNVVVTMADAAEAILSDWAKATKQSRNQLMRDLLVIGAKASGNARAIALKAAMHTPAFVCLSMIGWIYTAPFIRGEVDQDEMRGGRVVRTSRVRDLEGEAI